MPFLENPTGTGKLKQVVQELKNTSYYPNIAVLGSRELLCVNEKVYKLQEIQQNFACRLTCKDRRCMYKLSFDSYAKWLKHQAQARNYTLKEKTVDHTGIGYLKRRLLLCRTTISLTLGMAFGRYFHRKLHTDLWRGTQCVQHPFLFSISITKRSGS
ncbi:unnamed protein product [Peronospora belbahrii]|uniref:RAD3-like helicase DEAD domain-containing protein n=1 Tax=Peronospora belbahrii TaxID=622444 RepID=A0AAU9L3X1_9STRA|nr:unnamed protein product [Peronospora belbahrii]CAH0522029.1 unnamed protein product [Peronospora belbahrii]